MLGAAVEVQNVYFFFLFKDSSLKAGYGPGGITLQWGKFFIEYYYKLWKKWQQSPLDFSVNVLFSWNTLVTLFVKQYNRYFQIGVFVSILYTFSFIDYNIYMHTLSISNRFIQWRRYDLYAAQHHSSVFFIINIRIFRLTTCLRESYNEN